ncbi:21 kDa protein [Hibiscus syriacus]|uniref:21 kDa protein n=1 Tax=Hibiscus syriacus TaxID=106335 RepID=A0A6A3BWG7_HIBSY|nr:21 kDa protein [Hibiscus syriacus]
MKSFILTSSSSISAQFQLQLRRVRLQLHRIKCHRLHPYKLLRHLIPRPLLRFPLRLRQRHPTRPSSSSTYRYRRQPPRARHMALSSLTFPAKPTTAPTQEPAPPCTTASPTWVTRWTNPGSLTKCGSWWPPGSESFRFQMGNVQTWMSAALTDEETCTDGFEDVGDGPLKAAVCEGGNVKKFTSNALALVNSYAENGTN